MSGILAQGRGTGKRTMTENSTVMVHEVQHLKVEKHQMLLKGVDH